MSSEPLRIVFDTNIYISAIIFGGNPQVCLDIAREGEIKLYSSGVILTELASVLGEKFGFSDELITNILLGLSQFVLLVEPTERLNVIKTDPEDNKILEVAKEVKADFIISGDKRHLLPLKIFGKTKIVSAAEFLKSF